MNTLAQNQEPATLHNDARTRESRKHVKTQRTSRSSGGRVQTSIRIGIRVLRRARATLATAGKHRNPAETPRNSAGSRQVSGEATSEGASLQPADANAARHNGQGVEVKAKRKGSPHVSQSELKIKREPGVHKAEKEKCPKER